MSIIRVCNSEINAQTVHHYRFYVLLFFFGEKAITHVSIFPGSSMWVSYQSAVFSQAYRRIVFSVAVLKVADILSRASRGTAISLFLPPSFSLSGLSFSMSEGGEGEESARLLNYELLAFQFLQSARLKGRERARARKYVLKKLF